MLPQVLALLPEARGVLVTAGGSGSAYAFHASSGGGGGKPDLTGIVPALKVDVYDTTGAGDGFLGGFLHFLLKAGGHGGLAHIWSGVFRGSVAALACESWPSTPQARVNGVEYMACAQLGVQGMIPDFGNHPLI